MTWYQIDVSYACAGIGVDEEGIVRRAAPVYRWMVGKHMVDILHWVKGKNGEIQEVTP